MSKRYRLSEQRKTFMVSMRNDVRIMEYPASLHFNYFDQYAGRRLLRERYEKTVYRVLLCILLPFMMLATDFYLPLKYLHKKIKGGKKRIASKRYFLNHERNLYSITKRINLQREGDIWIRTPFDNFDLPADLETISIADLISFADLIKSLYQAVLLHASSIFQLGYDKYLLSYNAYEWCLNDLALRRLPLDAEFLYSCIYDRQAIMYDHLPQTKKVLIQHGGMFMHHKLVADSPYFEWQEDVNFYIIKGYYKSSPSLVYCFTNDDEIALKRSVIANAPQFIQIGYGFKPAYTPTKKSVLIVGYYTLNADKEMGILQQLQDLDIELILKNHPTIDDSLYDGMIHDYKFTFIEGKSNQMPGVDLVLTYESTLAYEYKSIGTKVLFYDDIDLNNIRTIVRKELGLAM